MNTTHLDFPALAAEFVEVGEMGEGVGRIFLPIDCQMNPITKIFAPLMPVMIGASFNFHLADEFKKTVQV